MITKQMFATEPDWIRGAIENHRGWIESVQGVSIDQMVVLNTENNFTSFAVRQLLKGVQTIDQPNRATSKLEDDVASIDFPIGMPPLLRTKIVSKAKKSFKNMRSAWDIGWGDTPVAIRFKALQGAIVAMELPLFENDSTTWKEIVICRKNEVAQVLEMIRKVNVKDEGALYSTGRGFKSIKSSSWDDLVLDDNVVNLVKNDYESFFEREKWFLELKLPFRRGYLLHGPPGNGKTSVIRAMLSRRGMRGLTLNFFAPEIDDNDLQGMFERAGDCAPSIIVLEDIDRAFPKNQISGTKCNVSLQQLLNCLDGIATNDGVVVVATANEPTDLDPAILRRPGRFDRVVLFPNPNAQLRFQYLHYLNAGLSQAALKPAIDISDGFSFAQMREVYILAGQRAFERHGSIEPNDILDAVQVLRRGFATVKERHGTAGFGLSRKFADLDSASINFDKFGL